MKTQRAIALAVALFLALSPQQFLASPALANVNARQNAYIDNGIGALNPNDRVTLALLNQLTGGVQSVTTYESVILSRFLAFNVRQVLLDIGWQNYSVGSVPFEQWVNDWLTASDILGLQNVLYLSQFTDQGVGSTWIMSLIKADPSTQTFYANGTGADYVSLDNPDVAAAVEADLSLLYSYYGSHSSWVGIGTGTANDPYYQSGSQLPDMGYSNSSMQLFANSAFFENDVNQTGFHADGTSDPIWNSFLNSSDVITLSSGSLVSSSPTTVYSKNSLAVRLYLPAPEPAISVQWYGRTVGDPGILHSSIYSDANGTLETILPLSSRNDSSSSFTNQVGWQSPMTYSSKFQAGNYWIVFSCPSCNATNSYSMFVSNRVASGQNAEVSGYGNWETIGAGILWVKNQNGTDLVVYPYQSAFSGVSSQAFLATSSFSFNTVFVYISQQYLDPLNATLSLRDLTTGQNLASATLSQALVHGLEGWVPIQLGEIVDATAGNTYSFNVTEPINSLNNGHSWQSTLWGLHTDPASQGFQNQSNYMLFRLALVNMSQTQFDYTTMGQVSLQNKGQLDAIRFIPSTNEMINSIQLLMSGHSSNAGNYTKGSFIVSLWSGNSSEPASPLSQGISTPAADVPVSGWLNVSGFNYNLEAGLTYWIVLSTNGTGSFSLARFGNPYASPVQVSQDSGKSWGNPSSGPADLGYIVHLSNQTIGNPILSVGATTISPSKIIAQPFVATSNKQLLGVYLGPISKIQSLQPNDYLAVSVRPDNGSDAPSGAVLASGRYSGNNLTAGSMDLVQFSSVARLQVGQRYWIVIQPVGGIYSVSSDVYGNLTFPGFNDQSAMISPAGGYSWTNFTEGIAVIGYSLLVPTSPLPSFNTSQIYADLSEYHNFTTNLGNLKGWNAYIRSSELWAYNNITTVFSDQTGKNWTFYAAIEPNVLDTFGYGAINNLFDSSSMNTCNATSAYFLNEIPLQGRQFHNIPSLSALQNCQLSSMLNQLGYMKFMGGMFGESSQIRLLVFSDSSIRNNLTNYLSNLFNTMSLNVNSGADQIANVNLSNFNAIIWLSRNSSTNSDLQQSIRNYVLNGGEFIVVQNPAEWQENVLGYNSSTTNSLSTESVSNFLNTITTNTGYGGAIAPQVLQNGSAIASDSSLTIKLHEYGSGRVVLLQGKTDLHSTSQISDGTTLICNTIANSLGANTFSPIWFANPSLNTTQALGYSIAGTFGNPLLFWLTNPTPSAASLSVHFNGTYFGFGSGWLAFNLNDFTEMVGNSSSISMNVTLAPESWDPIYFVPRTDYSPILYSSGVPLTQFVYPNQELYSIAAVSNQSVFLAIPFHSNVKSILLNDKSEIPGLNSSQGVINSRAGWYLNNQTNILTIRYVSSGNDTVRVLEVENSQNANNFPLTKVLTVLAAAVVVEVGITSYLMLVRRRRRTGHA